MGRDNHHTIERINDRYDINLNANDLYYINELIRYKKSKFIRNTIDSEIHEIPFNGKHLRVVYNKMKGRIVTALPQRTFDIKLGDIFNMKGE